jgi:hypothetical protein
MSNSQIFAKGGRSSHTNHANLFRNSSLFNVAHTGPAMTGKLSVSSAFSDHAIRGRNSIHRIAAQSVSCPCVSA